MKTSDYISVGMIAIVGTIIAYFLMNSLLGDPAEKTLSFEYLDGGTSELVKPDSEMFNAGAINPTVEVYIGSCEDIDRDGKLDQTELEACGQANPTTATGETTSDDNNGLTKEENEAINKAEGYASGTSAKQREAVQNQIDDYAEQQTQSQNKDCDLDGNGVVSTTELQVCNSARQETTSTGN